LQEDNAANEKLRGEGRRPPEPNQDQANQEAISLPDRKPAFQEYGLSVNSSRVIRERRGSGAAESD
jgi:hypothetical protein